MRQWLHARLLRVLHLVLDAQRETKLNGTDLQTRRSFR